MEIIEKIKKLRLPEKQFVVMGSAILEVKGIREAKDLDIMITRDLFEKLKTDPSWTYIHKKGRLGDEREGLQREGIELYNSVWGREDYDYGRLVLHFLHHYVPAYTRPCCTVVPFRDPRERSR